VPGQKELLNINSNSKIWWQSKWKATIEQGWNNLVNADLFSLSHPLHRSTFRYTGAPYGQVDIVPIRASIDVLQKYKTLMFLGWNTMTPEIYAKLKEYVRNGGTLFMNLPQLSQQIERKPELELINNGDFRDLFGVTVKGKLERKADEKASNIVRFDRESSLEQCKFPLGTTFTYTNDCPDLEWADVSVAGAKVLASVNDGKIPVLIENKLGKGIACLMTSYSFSPAPAEFVRPLSLERSKPARLNCLVNWMRKKTLTTRFIPAR
jgi:hypothetical protein